VKSSPLSALSTCGLVFHTFSTVQQSAPRLCTTLTTHQLTDHSQLKHLFAYLWCVFLLSSYMCYSVKTRRPGYHHTVFKMFVSYVCDNIPSHVRRYGGFSSTFIPFTDSAGLLYLLPTFKESFV